MRRSRPGRPALFRRPAAKVVSAAPHRRRRGKPESAGKLSAGFGDLAGNSVQSHSPQSAVGSAPSSILHPPPAPLFFPPWEILPHEGKLPHADVISDRLQTLVALADESAVHSPQSNIVVTCVTALLQKTFAPDDLKNRTRRLQRGDKIAPLDLIEWLEEQGYEPEAQVSQKGEIALRGGIVDLFPPTSPWPVRLEFFGDELESLRHFDPLTQISREEISEITIPPAGELGILKRSARRPNRPTTSRFATLLDYLPRETIFLLCEPERLALRADEYAAQIPAGDPFFISWPDFLKEANRRGLTSIELGDAETIGAPGTGPASFNPASSNEPNRCSALRSSPRSTPSVRSPNARRNRKSPRRSAANFSSNFTAGCGRITPSTSFATTTASGSGLRKSGRNLVGQASRLSPSEKNRTNESETGATPVLRCTSARLRAVLFATRPNWSSSPTRRFLAATKSSVRAGSNRRMRWPRVPRSTLISPIWRKATSSCICNTASADFSA